MIPAVVVPEGPAKGAYEKAATSLLCDCGCAPQSIKECACMRAEELRTSIAADATAGKSGDQIIAGYVARNGQKILVSPPAAGFNLIAWLGPAAGLLAAALLIGGVISRWKRASKPAAGSPAAGVSDADLARLARDLEDLR
ncbi:MAG TPA: cytochrome c-type biogenesis protein CcmH [Candidatus Polarisedimenticolaceae bacterium]|nr:cytochrome c-type biogenesis protein CcmH [Candidatus Polarisedimenticolaceae bacterium]